MTHVTVIGLGAMGAKMAEVLLAAGHQVSVWNRTRSKAEPLLALGARWADTPEGELVVVSQLDYQAMYDSLGSARLDGKVVVNLSSDTPRRLREASDWVAERGGVLVTAGIMSPPQGIGQPGMSSYYSGPKEALDRHTAALEAISQVTYLGPDPGLSMAFYQAGILMFWSGLTSFMHAVSLVGEFGAKPSELLPLAQGLMSDLAVEGPMGYLKILSDSFEAGEYPGENNSLTMQVIGMRHVVESLGDADVDTTWPRELLALFERAEKAGHGQDGIGSVIEVIRKP